LLRPVFVFVESLVWLLPAGLLSTGLLSTGLLSTGLLSTGLLSTGLLSSRLLSTGLLSPGLLGQKPAEVFLVNIPVSIQVPCPVTGYPVLKALLHARARLLSSWLLTSRRLRPRIPAQAQYQQRRAQRGERGKEKTRSLFHDFCSLFWNFLSLFSDALKFKITFPEPSVSDAHHLDSKKFQVIDGPTIMKSVARNSKYFLAHRLALTPSGKTLIVGLSPLNFRAWFKIPGYGVTHQAV
jgi:hypothetical protein